MICSNYLYVNYNKDVNNHQDLTEIESHIETAHQITQDFDKNYTTTEIEGPATESDNKIVLQDCYCLLHLIENESPHILHNP